jgi:serine/threonine protein kinase
MNGSDPCPDRALLEGFVYNRLQPEQSRTVEDHLLHCDTCLSALEAACGLDAVRAALLQPPSQADTQDGSVVNDLIERGRRLHEQPTTTPPHAAAAVGSDATPTTAPPAGGAELLVLAPPQGPGEIGRLGPYRVLQLLGKGGMGTVYLAEDPHLGRQVALKTLQPGLAADPRARERFLREARTAAALEHDHIVPIFHVGIEQSVPFLAMPLLKGESLETHLEAERKLPPAEAVRVTREAAEALACAHAAGLIHRDIKPGNLWLEPPPRRRVKVLDFGLARPVTLGQGLTETGALVGTPGYMAPEVAGGEALDGRADLFSLGVVLYAC